MKLVGTALVLLLGVSALPGCPAPAASDGPAIAASEASAALEVSGGPAVVLPFGAGDRVGYPVSQAFGLLGAGGSHTGVDIAAPCGVPVVAVSQGKVVQVSAGRSAERERFVVVRHTAGAQRFHAYYGHLASSQVRAGQPVRVGQRLGTVGASGHASGCHLHLAIGPRDALRSGYVGGDPRARGFVDPLAFLQALGAGQSASTQQPPGAPSPRPHIR